MSAITDLAKHIKQRDNPAPYSPMFGTIIALPELTIRLGDKVLLYAEDIKSIFDLYERDSDGRYIYLGKEVVALPHSDDNKFVVIGVVQ